MRLTPRDLDLLETLTCRVPLLALRHAVQLGWHDAHRRGSARGRLRLLAKAGWIKLQTVNAHPLLTSERPLFVWELGDREPDAQSLSRIARQRWSQAARPTEICRATSTTAAIFGSTAGQLKTLMHLDHDLQLADVYVRYRLNQPDLAKRWIGEHALPKGGFRVKNPDALLRTKCGRALRAIESVGRWSVSQVESFHEHCAANRLPYEMW